MKLHIWPLPLGALVLFGVARYRFDHWEEYAVLAAFFVIVNLVNYSVKLKEPK